MTDPMAELDNELEETKRKLANWNVMLEFVMSATAGKKAKTGENGLEYKAQVNSAMMETVFKICKFLTSPKQETHFMEQVLQELGVASLKGEGDDTIRARGQFLVTYKKFHFRIKRFARLCTSAYEGRGWAWLGSHANMLYHHGRKLSAVLIVTLWIIIRQIRMLFCSTLT